MASTSSTQFFGLGDESQNQMMLQQQSSTTTSSTGPMPPPPKKKRNQPGTPNPDAEVIALSPKTLMATNRFICEVCNKGFQREQNLCLHRRGHNLPWKLKQKTTKDVKRKVYLCPEPTCVHHDPSRALGDLTGIKKHYSRKHGEKKWKCEKCSKRYAVQSDWKAHSKICGTREYRCDCGTLFSRRDSFITHRAFCDALAQESARHPSSLNTLGNNLYGNNIGLGLSHQVGSQLPILQTHNHPPSNMLRLGGASNSSNFSQPPHPMPPPPATFFKPEAADSARSPKPQSLSGLMQLPNLQGNSSASQSNLFNLSFFGNNAAAASDNATTATAAANFPSQGFLGQFNGGNNGSNQPSGLFSDDRVGSGFSSLFNASAQNESVVAHMSATALLQKAAQMGSITSGNSSSLLGGLGSSSGGGGSAVNRQMGSVNFSGGSGSFPDSGGKLPPQMESESHLRGLISSFAGGSSSIFGGGGGHEHENSFSGFNESNMSLDHHHHHQDQSSASFCNVNDAKLHQNLTTSMGGSDKLTLDFLGVGGMMRKRTDGGFAHREQQQQQHGTINMSSLDRDRKSEQGSQPFGSSKCIEGIDS
ncbi:LOW QUALITY PROTEIN: protein indeterminate-domain 4, chloroplastic [Eucalyptus grandis]|uniref:LOW QUALITY PROTEIN: protein indeterminate-domain 4, chloroplastic n=1 Tax=Eucalyptus grandis TaxID=71139 RepID=UPI00192EE88C|nr:LOW QUALITY PROTEIN: protein indeterminate-domain 4, chloroplastic [Eucalyptus grandis]